MLGFNSLLAAAGVDVASTRLLRHETRRHSRTPYELWRDDPAEFDHYQRLQKRSRRAYFKGPIWASFVVAPSGRTLFAGASVVRLSGAAPAGWIDPLSGRDDERFADYDLYDLDPIPALAVYSGRVSVDWGAGTRSWSQRAAERDKPITELRETFAEPSYPGHAAFVADLSTIEALPPGWRGALAATRGVYLLTCPRTREQYVGSASGEAGFLGRWLCYSRDTYGGNVALRSREPSDYQVTILQVAGSADTQEDVLAMEGLWKRKLQSREMGLNRN